MHLTRLPGTYQPHVNFRTTALKISSFAVKKVTQLEEYRNSLVFFFYKQSFYMIVTQKFLIFLCV